MPPFLHHPLPAELSSTDPRQNERERLRVSRFDMVTSFLTSLLVFVANLAAGVLLVWLTSHWRLPVPDVVVSLERPSGTQNAPGVEEDFEPPGVDEVEELLEPALPDSLEAVTDAVSTLAASTETQSLLEVASKSQQLGDHRQPGLPSDGQKMIPRYLRWQLDFQARDLASYAAQLDFFRMELGVVGGSVPGVDLVYDLVDGPRSRHQENPESETRLYFMWTGASPLMRFDEELVRRSGVPLTGRQIIRFIPKDLEHETLAKLELEYARARGYESVDQIAKSVFTCEPDGDGYRFRVTNQRYRKVFR